MRDYEDEKVYYFVGGTGFRIYETYEEAKNSLHFRGNNITSMTGKQIKEIFKLNGWL